MKKIILSLAAVGALATALPAAAQSYRDHDRQDGYGRDGYHQDYRGGTQRLTTAYVDSLDWKIQNAAREGRLSWPDARELRNEFRQVRPIAWRVQTGEARRWEIERLDRTVTRIEQAVNGPRYGQGYGRGYDRDDRREGWRR
jgi:hypothetical protein